MSDDGAAGTSSHFPCTPAGSLTRALTVLSEAVATSDSLFPACLQRAVTDGVDLQAAAVLHGLTPLLYHRLRAAGLERTLPPEQWERLVQGYLNRARRQQVLGGYAREVFAALQQAGIPFLPIKGLALWALLGVEQLPREIVDLDLLVPPESVEPALQVILSSGFERPPIPRRPTAWEYHLPRLERTQIPLELHWRLWPRGPLQPFDLPDPQALLSETVSGVLQEQKVSVPPAATQLLLQAAGLAVDGLAGQLRHWADLYWLVLRLDETGEELLWEQAARWRMSGYLRVVLAVLAEIWPSELGALDGDALSAPGRTVRDIALRRLRQAPVRRASFWMLLAWRRLTGAHDEESDWRGKLPPELRAEAVSSLGSGALAQTGGAFVAGSRLIRRAALWIASRKEREALREELALAQALQELAGE